METDVLLGAGHINPEAGYGPWPAAEAWARDGTVPLTP
jgi:predicted alpha/beta hydrolase family esterase